MENIENETVEEKWRKTGTAFLETSENVLGFKEKNKKKLNDSTDLGKD